jgi:protocatechuate 3,4-dioxygenase beta subunit
MDMHPPGQSQNVSQEFKDVELVANGYTISTRAGTLARIGDEYVMRKRGCQRIAVPAVTDLATLVRTWTAFRGSTAMDAAIRVDIPGQHANSQTDGTSCVGATDHALSTGRTTMDMSQVDGRRALGELITIRGRVLDEAGRPVPDAMIEIWQTNSAGRYRHEAHSHDAPLDENFGGNAQVCTGRDGWYQLTTIRPGNYPNAGVLRPNHIHYVLSGPGFANPFFAEMYFPGDPLVPRDAKLNSLCPNPAIRDRLVARFDAGVTTPEFGLGYRFDLVLRGKAATPLGNEKQHSWLGA